MGQPRRRGYPHGRHHRCPRGIALPAAGAGLLFLSVSLLSVSLLSAPPLADPRPGLGTSSSSSRRFLRRHPVWTDPNSSPASLVRASRSDSLSLPLSSLLCMSPQTNGSDGELEGSESGDAFSVPVRWELITCGLWFGLCIDESNLDWCLYLYVLVGLSSVSHQTIWPILSVLKHRKC